MGEESGMTDEGVGGSEGRVKRGVVGGAEEMGG